MLINCIVTRAASDFHDLLSHMEHSLRAQTYRQPTVGMTDNGIEQ